LGTRVVVDGVLTQQHETLQMMNPRLEFTT